MTPGLQAAAWGLASGAAIAVPAWVASVVRRDASLVDRFWPWLIAGPSCVYAALAPSVGTVTALMLVLLLAWALRLSAFITWRNWGHGEDRRYRAIRERNEPNFALKSLVLVFGLQAVLGWVVSAPLFAAAVQAPVASGASQAGAWEAIGPLGAAGAALALLGIVFEAVADAQMARFKAGAGQAGQVMDRGLWRWSRHPNYFGEACVWWGLWVMALAAAGAAAWWSVVSPVLMTVLLLKVSGVSLLERDIRERRPAYADYVARTSAFVPWPPKPRASGGPGTKAGSPAAQAHR